MPEQIVEQIPEQIILRLKVSIQGGVPHVDAVDDLLHHGFIRGFPGQKDIAGGKDCPPCFLLFSIE